MQPNPELERVMQTLKEKHLDAIQALAAKPLAPEDFQIRGARVINSQRDHYYTRFSMSALDEVVEMLPGRPLMVGHDYRELPVGRFFQARRTFTDAPQRPRADSYAVEGLFYVPRGAQGDQIVRNVDLGIYREVSLGWRCSGLACSICGHEMNDMTRCGHVPGELYAKGVAEGRFSGITAVLEASLVFAGGQIDTQTFDPDVTARFIGVADPTFEEWYRGWAQA